MPALLTALALSGFAANSLLCRLALAGGHRIDAVTFTAVRILSGALMLALLAGPRQALAHGSAGSALALLGYAVAFSLAYVRIGAAAGALLLFGAVQLTMLAGALARGEPVGRRALIGLGFALGGIAWLIAPGVGAPSPLGGTLMVGAGASWGVYSLLGRDAADAMAATAGNFVRAALPAAGLLIATQLRHDALATPAGVTLAVGSGTIASGLCYAAWYAVLPKLGAARAGVLQLLVPVFAALAAVPMLGEPLTLHLLGAGGIVIGGVAIAVIRPRRRS